MQKFENTSWSGKCPFGEMSQSGNVQLGKCPVGELSVRGNVRRRSVRRGSVSRGFVLGEVSGWETVLLSCLDKVLESLTNKIQSFERFKNFRHFWVFVLSYRANSKRRKRWKITNLVKLFYCSVFFKSVDYVFCLTELFQMSFILLSGVSGVSVVSVELTWSLKTIFELTEN